MSKETIVAVYNLGGVTTYPCKESRNAAQEAFRLGGFQNPQAAPWFSWAMESDIYPERYWSEHIVEIIDLKAWRAYQYEKKAPWFFGLFCLVAFSSFVGVPTEDGMVGGWFWRACLWMYESGYH